LEESGRGLILGLPTVSAFAWQTEETHENPQAGWVIFGSGVEPRTSPMRSSSAIHSVPTSEMFIIPVFRLSRTMALGSTQPLTEINTRNLPGDKGQPALKAVSLTAICEPIA
jgi:hypothetical protein